MKSIQFAKLPPAPAVAPTRRRRYGGRVLYALVIVACVVTPRAVKQHFAASHHPARAPFVWTHCGDRPGRIAVEVDNSNYEGHQITVTVHAGTVTATGQPNSYGWTVVDMPATAARTATVVATIDGQPRPTAHVDLPGPDCADHYS